MTSKTLPTEIPGFEPVDYASHGNAILGLRDTGKTITAQGIAEKLMEHDVPLTVIDPIGRWRFLRVPGAGANAKGYPIVVAGGNHGDLPLTPDNAEELCRAAMQNRVSIVFDLYTMKMPKADWKRICSAVVRTLLYENESYGLRHIFIEEAAEFVPQILPKDGVTGQVYAEIEKLARMGGNALLGYTLINQRAEQVNKAVLELCDTLILHRQKGQNSLDSLAKWLRVAGAKGDQQRIIESMPMLKQGEAWVWPSSSDKPTRIRFNLKRSFVWDRRSMTGAAATVAPPADVAAFITTMKEALERQAEKKAAPKPAKATAIAAGVEGVTTFDQLIKSGEIHSIESARQAAYREGYAAGFNDCAKRAADALAGLVDVHMTQSEQMRIRLHDTRAMFMAPAPAGILAGSRSTDAAGPPTIAHAAHGMVATPLRRPNGDALVAGDLEAGKTYNVTLPAGTISDNDPVLQTVARHHPVALTWSQIMTMLGRKARGGHFNTQRKRLLEQGYVTEHNDAVIAADRLWTIVEKPERPADLTEVFRKTLPDPARRIFEYLVQWHGPRCSEEQIGSALSLKPKGGHWNSAMSTLTRANLIFKTNGFIALNHHFLKGGN